MAVPQTCFLQCGPMKENLAMGNGALILIIYSLDTFKHVVYIQLLLVCMLVIVGVSLYPSLIVFKFVHPIVCIFSGTMRH